MIVFDGGETMGVNERAGWRGMGYDGEGGGMVHT